MTIILETISAGVYNIELYAFEAVLHLMFELYVPEYVQGVRWNDPAFGIKCPPAGPVIAE